MKTFFYNGNIVTMNGSAPAGEAVLTRDGFIAAVGSFDDVEKHCDGNTVHYNLNGRTMMPAFIEPHGRFYSAASSYAERNECDIFSALDIVQDEYLSCGIATVKEYAGIKAAEVLKRYADSGRLKLDVVICGDHADFEDISAMMGGVSGEYVNGIRLGGMGITVDGGYEEHAAWMRTAYKDTGEYGKPLIDRNSAEASIRYASENKIPVSAICCGDMAAELFISFAEKYRIIRPVISDGRLLGLDQLERVSRAGILTDFCIESVYRSGDACMDLFGAGRASMMCPTASAMKKGAAFAISRGSEEHSRSVIEAIWTAVNRITVKGIHLGSFQCTGIYPAVRGVTVNAAGLIGEASVKGTAANGKKADFVILSDDLLSSDKSRLRSVKVCGTVKDGIVVMAKQN